MRTESGLRGLESKYPLPEAAVPLARRLLAGHARPELPYPAGVVESIYFDTVALGAYEEKLASDLLKTKLRLRWYDGGGGVFVERKSRRGAEREKRRALSGIDAAELGRDGLAQAARIAPSLLARALGEPVAGDLRPVLHLRYRRERHVAAAGPRLNLDWRLEVVGVATWLGASPPPGPIASAVLEVKGAERELPPWLDPLALFGCRRGSFSKYAAGLAACGL